MSLSWRLIISYILIILVTLVLAFVTLIFVVRPIQNRLVRVPLVAQSRQFGRQLNNIYRQNPSNDRVLQRLNSRLTNSPNHLVFIDSHGTVLADSQNIWTGNQLAIPEAESGTLKDPDGQTLLYGAVPVGPASNRIGYALAVSERTPLLTTLITEFGWGFVLAGLVALMVSLLLGILIARSIALPLQRIATAAGAVAVGHYEQRLPEKGPPEIERVAASFNAMASQVQASQQAMRDFVSNVSHELKTPLTSIQGFSQAIMEGATQDEAARRRAAGIIHQEAARMSRLVEDLLDLARIDSGQIVMNKTPLDINQILGSTVDRLLPQAVKKEVELVQEWSKLPPIVGDGDRLAQVFTNFLDNAVKHTPAGGRVTIRGTVARGILLPRRVRSGSVQRNATTSLSERGDFVEVSIHDTGPGIPPEDLARIFERFYQVDKSRQRGRGTGLGLAITKEIIEGHGGYVRANSTPSTGTKFIILLPVTEADARTLVSPRR
jgi:signal transduction histidine kinase